MLKKLFLLSVLTLNVFGLQAISLIKALSDNDEEKALFLIEINYDKKDLEIQDNKGHSALHIAANKGFYKVVKALCEKKVNLNQKDKFPWGNTPLHGAAKKNHAPVVKILLEYGADYTIQDYSGNIFLHGATVENSKEAIYTFFSFLKNNKPLLAKDFINLKNQGGRSIFQLSIIYSHSDLIYFFLKYGADINSQDKFGNTPLRNSIAKKNDTVTLLLIQKGANVTLLDKKNNSILHLAAMNGLTLVVKSILDTDPGVNFVRLKTSFGKTAAELVGENSDIAGFINEYLNAPTNEEIAMKHLWDSFGLSHYYLNEN